jgi:hypothetical protein
MKEELKGNSIFRGARLNSYGRTLTRVCLRAQRLESVLRMVEWGGSDTGGRGPCGMCSRWPQQGHGEGCPVSEALAHRDPLGHAVESLEFLRDLVRNQQHTVETHSEMIKITLTDLHCVLDEVAQMLDRL